MARDLRDGASLSDATDARPGLFRPDSRVLVRAGEESGRLGEILQSAQRYASLRARFARSVARFISYLGIGALVAALAIAVMFWCVRQMRDAYDQINIALPQATAILFKISNPIWMLPLILILTAGFLTFLPWLLSRTSLGGQILYRLPLWNRFQKHHDLSIFCRALSLRLSGGAPLPGALACASAALGNRHARAISQNLMRRVEEGVPLSTAITSELFFPHALDTAVSLGEKRGDLAKAFEIFADIYASDMERAISGLLHIMPPVGVLALGSMIALTTLTLFLPLLCFCGC